MDRGREEIAKPKYKLSKAGYEELMERLSKVAQEQFSEENEILSTANVSTSFVEKITKVSGLQDVIDRNEELTRKYKGLLDLYGFESLYDMYMYAKHCDSNVLEKASKDYSKLVPVKRKIMRGGKEIEVTIYEDPNKDNNGDKQDQDEIGQEETYATHARELQHKLFDRKDTQNTENVAELKNIAEKMPNGDKPFKDTSDFYFTVTDDKGNVVGIVGYSEEGEYLVMDFYRSNGKVSGVASRGFFELMLLALKEKKGVKVEDDPKARPIFMKSGLVQKGDHWVISAEDLQTAFGGASG